MRAQRGKVIQGERFLLAMAGGKEIVAQVTAAPLRQDGHIRGSIVVWHDVTERESLLTEIAQRAAELDASLNSIADGLIISAVTEQRYGGRTRLLIACWSSPGSTGRIRCGRWLARHARTPEGEPIPP